ncbi:DUF4105 domain-containing protein [Aurantibacter sp.]|uniref:lipoprotein N-acyltransferase Lnb domain-containing protein n=1 Tax=Aurantibacter sp. TaxID=2807103 RepID=UPI00326438B9
MRKFILLVFILIFVNNAYSQKVQLSASSKISVLTCGPGEVLYTAFGHSAIRVQDQAQNIDVVYNFGVFSARGMEFYYEFSQGRMDYLLARSYFSDFLYEYKLENRWVKEQLLNLDLKQRNELFQFLENNARPENRIYKYDYLLNNCATKIWDVQKNVFGDQLIFDPNYIDTLYTFRELMQQNLKTNTWGQFGIDLALGAVIDRKATPEEHMFLPEYVSKQLKKSKLGNQVLSPNEKEIVASIEQEVENNFFLSPLFWFLIGLIITGLVTYNDVNKNKRSRWFDFLLFLITGLHGLLIFYLWFLTDHIWTVNNFNILWLFPLNIITAFFLLKKSLPKWLPKYLILLITLISITCILWLVKIQSFSVLIIPIILLLIIRYLFLYSRFSSK